MDSLHIYWSGLNVSAWRTFSALHPYQLVLFQSWRQCSLYGFRGFARLEFGLSSANEYAYESAPLGAGCFGQTEKPKEAKRLAKFAANDQLMISFVIAIALMTPPVMVLARNGAFPILMLCALISLVVLLRAYINGQNGVGILKVFDDSVWRRSFFSLTFALLAYASVTIFWAPDRGRATATVFSIASITIATGICTLPTLAWWRQMRWLHWAMALILVACSVLIISELNNGRLIRKAIGASTDAFRLNRATVAGVLFLPLLYLIPSGDRKKYIVFISTFCVALAAFSSISESAKLSFLVISVIFMAGSIFDARRVALLVIFGILITHIFAPLIAVGLYATLSQERWNTIASLIPVHQQQYIRLEIFAAFAEQVIQAPILGHGLQASPSAPELYEGSDSRIEFALTFTHPHNFSLQVWYELGLVGAALTTALLSVIAKALLDMPSPRLLAATALAGGVWSVAYVSHGAWQHWWWALVGIVLTLFVAFARIDDAYRAKEDKLAFAGDHAP